MSTLTQMTSYDPQGPLPTGTALLEASAGTGKTYTIAALVVRYLAEGVADVGDLLVVTFSRAATAELRGRVRDRLVDTVTRIRGHLAGEPWPEDADATDLLLASGSDAAVCERLERLERAIREFDRATIMTTHEFCASMIRGLGVLAPQEPLATMVEDLTPLADEVASDLYAARVGAGDLPPFEFFDTKKSIYEEPATGAQSLVRALLVAPDAAVGPTDLAGNGQDEPRERVEFVLEARRELETRKQRQRLYSFADQLERLDRALHDPETGPSAQQRLSRRFPVVLVDEFQDTDPVQWSILKAAFADHGNTLVLIGDPKQSIYKFRGADIATYSVARDAADLPLTLATNYRSDKRVVQAVNALFKGVQVGDGIGVPPVTAAHDDLGLDAPADSPYSHGLQVRVVEGDQRDWPGEVRPKVDADVVATVRDLLSSHLRFDGRDVQRGDIAILVRANDAGESLARRLTKAGIPATFAGTRSVLALTPGDEPPLVPTPENSTPADAWITLLDALDQPRSPFLQRAVLTDFFDGTIADLVTADESDLSRWVTALRTWARALSTGGVPALRAALDADGFTARLLRRPGGERLVTDHRHIAELLHAAVGGPVSPRALAAWLRREGSSGSSSATDRVRRLETDDDAVQIMTVHRAKGLQFPVVLLPHFWSGWAVSERDQTLTLSNAQGRYLDVAGRAGAGREQRLDRYGHESSDEDLRALYVALTRAKAHIVAWWVPSRGTAASPLHRVIYADHTGQAARPPAEIPLWNLSCPTPLAVPWPDDSIVAVAPEQRRTAATRKQETAEEEAPPLAVAPWTRVIDQQWRRTSYSGLTAAAHHMPTVELELTDDEPAVEASETPTVADERLAVRSPMAALPSGAAFGTLVHAVYETVDAHGADWREQLSRTTHEIWPRLPIKGTDPDALATALAPSFETPLGPLASGITMRDIAPGDRLAELDFEIAMDAPGTTLAAVAALLRRHVPTDDVLAGYADALDDRTLTAQHLHGFLTGSIDAVWRVGGRFLVVDYKTNRFGPPAREAEGLPIGLYTREAMAEAMIRAHYPLQSLLYSVALHRYLGVRLRGYSPEEHLGGIAYLFVRGMAGPDTPVIDGHPLGVFSWKPPAPLVTDLSALLAGGAR